MGLAVMASCGGPPAPRAPAAPADPARIALDYDVRASGADLVIDARMVPGAGDELHVDDDATPFVRDVTYSSGGAWLPATIQGPSWKVPCGGVDGCRVRYHFELLRAAQTLNDPETAIASGAVVVAPPSTWLLRPEGVPGRFRFHAEAGMHFLAGTHPAPDGAPDAYEAATADLEDTSFAVFGPFHAQEVTSGTARVLVAVSPQGLSLDDAQVKAWVRSAVDAIAAYLGKFPVERTLVVVQRGTPGNPTRGVTLGAGGPGVLLRVGDDVTPATTRADWVLVHELLHVVLPSLSHDHAWLGEGIPSYVEPIVRLRAGLVTPEKLWGDLVDGLPQGLPEAGDKGLENTHTWGRTYWGGSLFCLMADVAIREQTRGARGFDDVVRGVVATGANVESRWEVKQLIDAGDAATGTHVLHDLYDTLALAPGTVDLPALWAKLGVKSTAGSVTFDDTAPLATVRRGIAGR
jgi:hypothetical protein